MESTYTSLTQNQKLLWIGQELNPESPMYNMVMTYEINDAISVPHFIKAFERLVNTNDVLRSVLELKDGEPIQRYNDAIDYEVLFKDFSNENKPQEVYYTWEKERVTRLLDVKKCLFDCVLIKLSDNRYIWYINQHHLITDGWSTTIMFSKMSQLYIEVLQNDIEHKAVSSYKEFVTHLDDGKSDEKYNEALSHWEEKQKNFPSIPALYYNKQKTLDTASKRLHFSLGKDRSEKIRELANKKGVRGWSMDLTLYNIFLTTLFAFVNRVSGQEQLVIGSPTHNRTKKSFHNILGYFVETFPLFAEFDENETFISLFQKVQVESNSFLKNAKAGTSTPDLNRGFNVFYNYINTNNTNFNGAKVKTSWVHSGHTDPRHHIRFHVHDFDNTGEIQLYFDLNSKVFDAEKQQLVPQHFIKLLDAFIDNISNEIRTVSLITESEMSTINKWNETYVDYPKNETLLTKFETQVLKTPNQVALVFKEESLTYKELDEKSNQVARFLIQKGVKNNDIIALSINRSLEMMIYIYGIIKAGAAYLPLATDLPTKRLEFILKDAASKVLFYNHSNIEGSVQENFECYDVTNIDDEISSLNTLKEQIHNSPEDLAYVIYTSGSTGEPKGVKCHHAGICNRLNWMNNDYPITPKDVCIQKTPITFDVSLWELFWPLQEGAKLIIEIPEGHKNPEKLINTIEQHQVTNIHFVPSMLNVFNQTIGIENCTSLKRIFCSGEALSVPIVKNAYDKLDIEIHNLYGPTEASVDVTSWYCEKSDLENVIPIGKPVANTQLYILDKNLNPLPIGLKGELYIAGVQVASGYLNREELTKERFVKNVFSSDASAIMYKTGDLARFRNDGIIEYHGRTDNQVKIRGLRVELGEIERTLEKIESISQAIVVVNEESNLLAYYTGDKIADIDIIKALELKLPDYMVPNFYAHLDNFELLPSGKVNRKKLPKYNVSDKEEHIIAKIEPRNEIEEIVHGIWKEILKIDKIGVNENFIRIGGNSLNAISITSRLKSTLELDVSIVDVFNYPTIEAYSHNIEKTITELLNE